MFTVVLVELNAVIFVILGDRLHPDAGPDQISITPDVNYCISFIADSFYSCQHYADPEQGSHPNDDDN